MLQRFASIGLIFSLFGICPVAYANVTDDLVGHWALDEGSGNAAVDSVSGNNGTWQGAGPHYVSDGPNGAAASGIFTYDDEGHYVSIPDAPAYEFNTYFSVSMWIKAEAWNPWNALIAKDNWDAQEGWALYVSDQAGGLGSLCYDAAGTSVFACTGHDVPLSQWVHVVVINDNGDASLYLDGALAGTGAVPLQNAAVDLYIGARHDNDGTSYTDNFLGNISHVRLYNRALTTDDIHTLYAERFVSSSSSSSSASVDTPHQSSGGSRGNSTKMIVEAMQKKMQMMQAHQATPSPTPSVSMQPKESMSPDLQKRACERVMKWFRTDAKMLGRVNERLQKRFGFMCGA